MSNEGTLIAAMVRMVRSEYPNAWVFKVHGNPYQMSGVPDLLICLDGRLFAAEAKHHRPGESVSARLGRVTPGQWLQLQRIEDAGGVVGVVWSVEMLRHMLSGENPPPLSWYREQLSGGKPM